ncbi:MAG: leucine-rich repeat protein [Candidatus Ornithomonoglobus sp.]
MLRKKLLSLLIAMTMFCAILPMSAAAASSGTCGADGANLTWTLDDNGTLTISGEGAMADGAISQWYSYNIRRVVVEEGVTSIGNNAFYGYTDYANRYCTNIASIELADSVTSIGAYAFYGCSGLVTADIGNGVKSIGDFAFCECGKLAAVDLPDTLTSIGSYAFYKCSALKEVTVPDSVTSIGSYVFQNCSSLKSAVLSKNLISWGDRVFRDCSALETVVMPEKITKIPNEAFYGCSKLVSVDLPEHVLSIGDSAFCGCSSLTEVNNRSAVIGSIDSYAFYGCSSLGSIDIGTWVTSIGSYAFYNCSSLKSVTVPNHVTSIAANTFYGCSAAESVVIGERVTSIGDSAFYNCSSLKNIYFCGTESAWNEVSIGDKNTYLTEASVTYNHALADSEWVYGAGEEIANGTCGSDSSNLAWSLDEFGTLTISGEGAMADGAISQWYSYNIRRVVVEEGVTSIGNNAFYGYTDYANRYCTNIASIELADSVTSIGAYAFYGCSGLVTADIGNGVKSIGDFAFCECGKLAAVDLPDTLTSIGSYAFYKCSALKEVTAPDSVTSIGSYAFQDCSSLKSAVLSKNLSSWGDRVFRDCLALETVVMPEKITEIPSETFYGCSKLTSVNIPDTVTGIGPYAFYNCSKLSSANIPSGVTSIGQYAFYNCSSLSGLVLPDYITSVSDHAFDGCTGLESIIVGKNVTSISDYAFNNDYSVSYLWLPAGVKTIGKYAFYNFESLEQVHFGGSEAEWKEMSIGDYNTYLKYAEVIYDSAPIATVAPIPTATPMPTEAPIPTATPMPTEAPIATATPIPTEAPSETTAPTEPTAPTTAPTGAPAETAAAPKIAIESFIGGKTVTLTTATDGAQIYYTTDGSAPTASSTLYSEPVTLTETATIKAIAVKEGIGDSKAVSGKITVLQAGTPTASHEDGELAAGTIITLKTETSGAVIYYTTDGTEPTTESIKYSGSIGINSAVTVKAVAVKDGYKTSDVFEASYIVPAVETGTAYVSLGSVTASAGDAVSVPVYIFTDEDISEYRFTLSYDASVFEYGSVTPAEGISSSDLFTSVSDGTVTVLCSSGSIESGEVCNINLTAISNAVDGRYAVTVDNIKITASGELEVEITDGVITLEGSNDSKLDKITAEVVLTDKDGNDVNDASEIENEVTANVIVDDAQLDETEAAAVNVILAVYDRSGVLVNLSSMEVDLSDVNYVFTHTIDIPEDVSVGSIKMMLWNSLGDMSPLTEASSII